MAAFGYQYNLDTSTQYLVQTSWGYRWVGPNSTEYWNTPVARPAERPAESALTPPQYHRLHLRRALVTTFPVVTELRRQRFGMSPETRRLHAQREARRRWNRVERKDAR